MDVLLAVGALASIACAVAWHVVAERLRHRARPPQHRAAGNALSLALHAGGAFMLVAAAVALLAALGGPLDDVGLPAAWAGLVCGVALAGGLVAYLAHLLTGRAGIVRLVAYVYAAGLGLLVAAVLALEPVGAVSTGWTVRFAFARAPLAANGVLASFVLAPAAIASLAYLTLLPAAPDPTGRWRIALVGGGLSLWLSMAIAGRLVGSDLGLALARGTGLLAGLSVYAAYAPPAWAVRRWGLRSLAAEIVRPPPDHAAFAARLRELV